MISTNYALSNHLRSTNPPRRSGNLLLGHEGVLAGDEEAGVREVGKMLIIMLHVVAIVVVIVGGLKLLSLLVTGESRLFPKD